MIMELKGIGALAVLIPLAIANLGLTFTQVQTEAPRVVAGAKQVTVEHIKIHGVALEGNLEGAAVDGDVIVFLPPSFVIDEWGRCRSSSPTGGDMAGTCDEATPKEAGSADLRLCEGPRLVAQPGMKAADRKNGGLRYPCLPSGADRRYPFEDKSACI
jgi:hypothetical protein